MSDQGCLLPLYRKYSQYILSPFDRVYVYALFLSLICTIPHCCGNVLMMIKGTNMGKRKSYKSKWMIDNTSSKKKICLSVVSLEYIVLNFFFFLFWSWVDTFKENFFYSLLCDRSLHIFTFHAKISDESVFRYYLASLSLWLCVLVLGVGAPNWLAWCHASDYQ